MPNRSISKVLKTIIYIYIVYHKKESAFLCLWVEIIGCSEAQYDLIHSLLAW